MTTASTRSVEDVSPRASAVTGRVTFLVFADDWGRHPSSAQHLFQRLLGRHDVLWVNTIGMRPPRFDLVTLLRGWQKLAQWFSPVRRAEGPESHAGPTVLNPRMWPRMRYRWERNWNVRLLTRELEPLLSKAARPVIAVTTLPISADLVGRLSVDRWVYYCVDDFANWPGLDRQPLMDLEHELVDKVDAAVAVSQVLMRRLQERGAAPQYLPHGVDLAHWQGSGGDDGETCLDRTASPRCLFWGLVDRRLDPQFLGALDAELSTGSIVLLGPTDQAPRSSAWQRVVCLPPLPYSMLPSVARQADVLIMPYVDAAVTRAMQPLKLLEYLATDRPVVARDLPANRDWADCLDLASTPEEFARLVKLRISTGLPAEQAAARAARLQAESWDRRADCFEQMLLDSLRGEGARP